MLFRADFNPGPAAPLEGRFYFTYCFIGCYIFVLLFVAWLFHVMVPFITQISDLNCYTFGWLFILFSLDRKLLTWSGIPITLPLTTRFTLRDHEDKFIKYWHPCVGVNICGFQFMVSVFQNMPLLPIQLTNDNSR